MTKYGLITADTAMMNGVPVVNLYLRDEGNNKRRFDAKFYPYFYITNADYLAMDPIVRDRMLMHAKDISGTPIRSLSKQVLTKITMDWSTSVTGVLKTLIKVTKNVLDIPSVFTYEGDLAQSGMLALRYLIDKNIRCGVEIDDTNPKHPKIVSPIEFIPLLRKWYIDFEALSSKQCGSGPKKEEPIPIVSFYDNYNGKLYTIIARNKKWLGRGAEFSEEKMFKPISKDHVIIIVNGEASLLDGILDKIDENDPDLFTAWNLDRYDIIKWVDRMKANGIDPNRLNSYGVFNWKNKPYKIKGRILFDLMRGFKRFTDAELRSYGLGAVAEEEGLDIPKIPLKKSTQDIWDNYPEILFHRNVNDVLIMVALDKKYDLVEMFDDLRREFGAMFSEVLMNYRVLDTALMRMVNGEIALKTSSRDEKVAESYLGAVVVEPIPGLEHYIAQFDFGREYPNLIKAFNIGPDTWVGPDSTYKGPCFIIEYQGKIFKFRKSPRSLLARLIDYFFAKRDMYEKKYKQAIASKDDVQIKAWYRKIFNVKKMTNAIYGVMDFPSFRLYNQNCSAATAVLGRIGVEEINRFLATIYYKLLYGDTDSVFVPLKARIQEEAIKEAQALAVQINDHLGAFFRVTYDLKSAPAELGLKKIYDSFLLVAKKNYAGRSFWDEKKGLKVDYDYKGLEMIRSDSSDFEKEIMEKIVRTVLDGDIAEVSRIRAEALRKLSSRALEPLAVSYPLQISGRLKDYPKLDKNGKPQMPAHVRAAIYTNTYLNTDYDAGDKPRRLPLTESLDVVDSQQTLFSRDKVYPTLCTWRNFTFTAKDISITEDFDIPERFLSRIDWDRITERLVGKMDKIEELIKHD